MSVVVAEQTRGPLVENLYRGDAAVVDSNGTLRFVVGDPQKATFWRSSAKPIQAMPIILSGAAQAFGFGPEHLAMFCASHNGELVHTEMVLDALQRAGLTPEVLRCGAHLPFDQASADVITQAGRHPESLHNNCSGKHTGMLALAKHLGEPLDGYLDPASTVQQLILAHVADVVGLAPEEIAIGVDGCGVPVFGLPVFNMAYAFARLADPAKMPAGEEEAGRQIRDAMLEFPYHVAGRKRLCTDLMRLPGDRFVAKSGAEGVYCVGVLPEAVQQSTHLRELGITGGIGIAVKVEDGNNHVRHIMVVEILRRLGLLTDEDHDALARYRALPVKNWAGRIVGETRAVFALQPYS